MVEKSYSLQELSELVELPRRTVRYYIQLGLLEGPVGETRSARYETHHLDRLLEIRRWQRAGYSLEQVKALVSGGQKVPRAREREAGAVEVWSHLVVANGLELHVEPGQSGLTPEQLHALFKKVMQAYVDVRTTTGENNA